MMDRFVDAIGKVDDRFLLEVLEYEKKIRIKKVVIRASFVAASICIMIGMFFCFNMGQNFSSNIFASGTNQRMANAKIEMSLGTITDEGSQKGFALGFYVMGKKIESITFSCENQWLEYFDMRDTWGEFSGLCKNFEILYGENDEEYCNILIQWVPKNIQRKLSEEENIGISDLSEEEKKDVIVLEITYLDGRKEIKKIKVFLNEDGLFTAQVDTNGVRKKILNKDKKHIESVNIEDVEEKNKEAGKVSDITEGKNNASLSDEEYERAIKLVEEYYASTVFNVTDIKYWEGKIPYRADYPEYEEDELVCFEISVQNCEVNRMIIVGSKDGWVNGEILNEGY